MDQRTRRSPARFLAPLALIAVLVAFLVIVGGSGGNGSNDSDNASSDTSAATTTKTTSKKATTKSTKTTAKKDSGSKTYTIQVGDTLGGIADKTGVPLDRIEELNPDVDPHAMVAGQKIKLE